MTRFHNCNLTVASKQHKGEKIQQQNPYLGSPLLLLLFSR